MANKAAQSAFFLGTGMQIIKKILGVILFASMVGISVITLMQLFARHLSIEFPGGGELAQLAAVWLYFMGMAHATFNGTHIQGGIEELITNRVATRAMRAVAVVALLLFSVIGLYLSVDMFVTTLAKKYVSIYYGIPMVFSVAALVLGFFLNVVAVIWRALTGAAFSDAAAASHIEV